MWGKPAPARIHGDHNTVVCHKTCGSELARDGLKGGAFIQKTRVIVNAHREQARSYTNLCASALA